MYQDAQLRRRMASVDAETVPMGRAQLPLGPGCRSSNEGNVIVWIPSRLVPTNSHAFLGTWGMQSLYTLYMLVDQYATQIEKLNLDGDQLEEYSTVLLHLQNQVETGEPSHKIVTHCLACLEKFSAPIAKIA